MGVVSTVTAAVSDSNPFNCFWVLNAFMLGHTLPNVFIALADLTGNFHVFILLRHKLKTKRKKKNPPG